MTMAVDGSSHGGVAAEEDYRRRLRDLLKANSGMLMTVLEHVAGTDDKNLLRNVIEASVFIFSGEQDALPGGRDFWARMRSNIAQAGDRLQPAGDTSRIWRSVGYLRRELDRYASERPEARKALDDFDRRGRMPVLSTMPAQTPPPAPSPARPGQAAAIEAELTSMQSKIPRPPAGPAGAPTEPAPPFAQVILPTERPRPGKPPEIAALLEKLEQKESELRKKDTLLKEYDEDMKRIHEQLVAQEAKGGATDLEEKLAIQEEETRLAHADLVKLEKKYRENLELLKEEARDRGSLQKELETTKGEVLQGQERLRAEREKLAETRTRLDNREKELESAEERLHVMELELVRKEEDINMAMQHLRDEEAERRRVLDALRQETREKAQMEHRLKRREEELTRLEARIVDEETRVEALKGSQAVSEEEAMRKAGELRRREGEVRAVEATTHARMEELQREEARIKERIAILKKDLRNGEVLEAQMKKREELSAELEARYRRKEDELLHELKAIERAKAGMEEDGGGTGSRARGAGATASGGITGEQERGITTSRSTEKVPGEGTASERPPSPETSPKAIPERQPEPAIPKRVKKTLVVPRPQEPRPEEGRPEEGESTTSPEKPPAPPADREDKRREEILDILSKKIKPK